jgi:dienelactone hydrolase
LADWRAALRHVRAQLTTRIDIARIALWGTSFSGGHVLSTAAAIDGVACCIAQVPFVGVSGVTLSGYQRWLAAKALITDKIASIWGGCVTVPVVGDRYTNKNCICRFVL